MQKTQKNTQINANKRKKTHLQYKIFQGNPKNSQVGKYWPKTSTKVNKVKTCKYVHILTLLCQNTFNFSEKYDNLCNFSRKTTSRKKHKSELGKTGQKCGTPGLAFFPPRKKHKNAKKPQKTQVAFFAPPCINPSLRNGKCSNF